MIETIFAMDEEETTPGMPEEGGDEGTGGNEMPTPEPESRLDDENGDSGEVMDAEARLQDGENDEGSSDTEE